MFPGKGSHIRKIAIIGAGPSGIAAAKYLLAEKAFETIRIYEQRSTTGGVWNYTPITGNGLPKAPTTSPGEPNGCPGNVVNGNPDASLASPMYEQLETNIPHFMMSYSDLPFPEDSQLFPGRETVLQYLQDYAKEVNSLICFDTQVLDVRHTSAADRPGWDVVTKHLLSHVEEQEFFDAVVVASGHYDVPYLPDIKGIAAWSRRYPGVVMHSRFYRTPEPFKDKKVVIVGNSSSGIDIGYQISHVCQRPLIVSRRRPSPLSIIPEERKEELPEIQEFILDQRALRFADGRVETNVDAVVFCTGYSYSYPFLSSLHPSVVDNGSRTRHVYKHIFCARQPTLAFLALPQKIIPFPLAECQAAVIARVWANRLEVPSQDEMDAWEETTLADRGSDKAFHVLTFPQDADYMKELYEWSLQGRPKPGVTGKTPPVWGDWERWIRSNIPAMKERFVKLGDARHGIRRVEELGQEWHHFQRPSTARPGTGHTQTEIHRIP